MRTILITGASRGLGLEFVRQYAADGWSVIACARSPQRATGLQALARGNPRVVVEALDVTDQDAVAGLAQRYRGRALDVLLNNAGMLGPAPLTEHLHRQHLGTLDFSLWEDILRTNTFGPVRVAEAFADHVAASAGKKLITLSSTVGSIAEGHRGAFGYATSKAALNKAMTLIAMLLEPRGVIVALLCPGYVKTDMNVGGATLEATDSVSGMRRLIAAMTLADSGSFTRYNGERIAW
jgi:NAD(P)-dependent dehydrogenase (short-subunit alcohol dehydrogenase family)